jgi:large subunit ribosomal protein L14e
MVHNVEIGRVCVVNYGPDAGKLCTVLDVVDQSRALVDGPSSMTGVARQTIPLTRLSLTPLVAKISRNARLSTLVKVWKKDGMQAQFDASTWGKKMARQQKRQNLTDFERFQVMVLRKKRSRIVSKAVSKLKKSKK